MASARKAPRTVAATSRAARIDQAASRGRRPIHAAGQRSDRLASPPISDENSTETRMLRPRLPARSSPGLLATMVPIRTPSAAATPMLRTTVARTLRITARSCTRSAFVAADAAYLVGGRRALEPRARPRGERGPGDLGEDALVVAARLAAIAQTVPAVGEAIEELTAAVDRERRPLRALRRDHGLVVAHAVAG